MKIRWHLLKPYIKNVQGFASSLYTAVCLFVDCSLFCGKIMCAFFLVTSYISTQIWETGKSSFAYLVTYWFSYVEIHFSPSIPINTRADFQVNTAVLAYVYNSAQNSKEVRFRHFHKLITHNTEYWTLDRIWLCILIYSVLIQSLSPYRNLHINLCKNV